MRLINSKLPALFILTVSVLFMSLIDSSTAETAQRHFSLFKKESSPGATLLVIGGIHGNEPGGYFAPMLFIKHYAIQKGTVLVVPNLNFDSIVRDSRGVYGDMNRKFDHINQDDKDYEIVKDIKSLILTPEVDMVLNLHDGHGFYREKEIDGLFNPKAWGQACIIDQSSIPDVQFGNLQEIASKVNNKTNVLLREDVHEFNVKNTHTAEKDEAMQQSLTFFAIKNKKPAFAIETSKNITDLSLKVFYQLKTIETFMDIMGIEYAKDFPLNVETIRTLLSDAGHLEIPACHITLPLSDIRKRLNNLPVNCGEVKCLSDNPLVALVKEEQNYKIVNGNMQLATLSAEPHNIDGSLEEVELILDGVRKTVRLGSVVSVTRAFEVAPVDEHRVNIIGFTQEGLESETGVEVTRNDIAPQFSIDNCASAFRVEVYKGSAFCGMIVVKFRTL